MSVAFRRESDEEHLEPRFARPIPPGPNLVTPEGRAMIEAAIGELEMRLATGLAGDDLTFAKRDLVYWQQRLTPTKSRNRLK